MSREAASEIVGVVKAAILRDLTDGSVGAQHPPRLFEAEYAKIDHGRKTGGHFEFAAQMGGGVAERSAQLLHGHLLRPVTFQVIDQRMDGLRPFSYNMMGQPTNQAVHIGHGFKIGIKPLRKYGVKGR